jgi:hypothetical protein
MLKSPDYLKATAACDTLANGTKIEQFLRWDYAPYNLSVGGGASLANEKN